MDYGRFLISEDILNMSTQEVKSVYLATNLEALNKLALHKQSLIADASPKSLAAIAQTLFDEARKAEDWDRDEEKAYVIFMRYLQTVIQVKKASQNVSSSEKKYCDEILEQNISKISEATSHVERLKRNLKRRYDVIYAKPSTSSTDNVPNSTYSSNKDKSSSSFFSLPTITKKKLLENQPLIPSFDRNLKPSRRNSVTDQQQEKQVRSHSISDQNKPPACVWCDAPFKQDSPSFLSIDAQEVICGTCYNYTMGFGSPSTSNSSTSQVINFNIHNSNVTVLESAGGGAAAVVPSNSQGSVLDNNNWCTFFTDSFSNHCNIGGSNNCCPEKRERDCENTFGKYKQNTSSAAWDLAGIDFTPPKCKESSPSTTSECVICCDNQVDHVFTPCGHLNCCEACAEEYKKSKGPNLECPICRTPATGIYKVYKV